MQRRVLPATGKQNHQGTARTGFLFSKFYPKFLGKCCISDFLFHDTFENRGTPKLMVYNGKPIKMDDLGGTIIFGNTQVSFALATSPCTSISLEP